MKRRILQHILKFLAKRVLRARKPKIVGVTGSVGKTSTKEAIYVVLRQYFNTRCSPGNANNELGVPLTVLGIQPGSHSWWDWLKHICQGYRAAADENYPAILVLEMGIDKPGDMKYLTELVRPDIGVVTAIGESPSHLEFFEDREALVREKKLLVDVLSKEGLAVLNYDDPTVKKMSERVKAPVLYYGFDEKTDLGISNFQPVINDLAAGDFGLNFKLCYRGSVVPVRLNKVFGRQQALAAAIAAAVGCHFGLNLVDISTALAKYRSLPGRGTLIKGIKHTWIIDGSYNASPAAVSANLAILDDFSEQADFRKIAVLGDMLELGANTEAGHRRIGQEAAKHADVLFAVGARAQFIAEEARRSMKSVFHFVSADEAALAVQNELREHDVVLVKGSRSIHLEKVVREIMAEPEKADELLVHL